MYMYNTAHHCYGAIIIASGALKMSKFRQQSMGQCSVVMVKNYNYFLYCSTKLILHTEGEVCNILVL